MTVEPIVQTSPRNAGPATRAAAFVVAAVLAAAGCASTTPTMPATAGKPASAAEGEGLLMSAHEVPPILKSAADAPYQVASRADCQALDQEIARLDEALGPDVDAEKPEAPGMVERAVAGAVRGAIPYRWVLRWMIGAEGKERAFAEAVQAGTARRGFLKGVRRGLGCSTG